MTGRGSLPPTPGNRTFCLARLCVASAFFPLRVHSYVQKGVRGRAYRASWCRGHFRSQSRVLLAANAEHQTGTCTSLYDRLHCGCESVRCVEPTLSAKIATFGDECVSGMSGPLSCRQTHANQFTLAFWRKTCTGPVGSGRGFVPTLDERMDKREMPVDKACVPSGLLHPG